MVKDIFINNQKINLNKEESSGTYVKIDGEDFYKITNYDKMNPFFMSIVSNSDHWMFVSSRGSLTAGRRNPDNALSHITPMIRFMILLIIPAQKLFLELSPIKDSIYGNPFLIDI